MTIKSGFTLVELVVVIAIFGFLAVVATNFLLATVSTNTRITIENEVRQNATLVMQNLRAEIRKSACVYFDGARTLTLSDSTADFSNKCKSDTSVEFIFDSNGVVAKNGETISSEQVAFVKCSGAGACSSVASEGCASGLLVATDDLNGFPTTQVVNVFVTARQRNATSRPDSCSRVTLSDTITPRNAGN